MEVPVRHVDVIRCEICLAPDPTIICIFTLAKSCGRQCHLKLQYKYAAFILKLQEEAARRVT